MTVPTTDFSWAKCLLHCADSHDRPERSGIAKAFRSINAVYSIFAFLAFDLQNSWPKFRFSRNLRRQLILGRRIVCPNATSTSNLKVKDVFDQHDVRVYESETMQEAATRAQGHLSLIPVFDYSQKYVGALQLSDFVEFQSQYFDNLKFCDRRNEFMFECGDSSDIHFVPIDQVSRYINKEIQPVSWNESVETVVRQLIDRKITALPVMDDEKNIVGSISLAEILQAENSNHPGHGKAKKASRAPVICCHG